MKLHASLMHASADSCDVDYVVVQSFEWFCVEHLPAHKKDNACKHLGLTPNSFFMVMPFVKYV